MTADTDVSIPDDENRRRLAESGSAWRSSLQFLRLLLGLVICFWLWAKWLYAPQLVFLPPLPPVEVFVSLVEEVLGRRLVALFPFVGLTLIVLDGLSFRRRKSLRPWVRRMVSGSLAVVLIHVSIWLLCSVAFFVLFALAPGSGVRGKAIADPAVQGLVLFCAFFALILAGPFTALAFAARSLSISSRDGARTTRVEALNTVAAVLLVPLLLLWMASGYPRDIVRAFRQEARGKRKDTGTALVAAARHGDTAAVRALIRSGAQVNAKDRIGVTALMTAAANGHLEIVRALIQAGTDVNAKSEIGRTALMDAVGSTNREIVRALIEARADVNATDADGTTALMLAGSQGQLEITRTLIQAGAEVNARSAGGDTALMSATRGGHAEIVRILIAADADVRAKDNKGDSALRMANRMSHPEIARLLRGAGAKD